MSGDSVWVIGSPPRCAPLRFAAGLYAPCRGIYLLLFSGYWPQLQSASVQLQWRLFRAALHCPSYLLQFFANRPASKVKVRSHRPVGLGADIRLSRLALADRRHLAVIAGERVQVVGPFLHQFAAFLNELRPVIRFLHVAFLGMR